MKFRKLRFQSNSFLFLFFLWFLSNQTESNRESFPIPELYATEYWELDRSPKAGLTKESEAPFPKLSNFSTSIPNQQTDWNKVSRSESEMKSNRQRKFVSKTLPENVGFWEISKAEISLVVTKKTVHSLNLKTHRAVGEKTTDS